MIKVRIKEVLEERKISNSAFSEMMGVKKQNVRLIFETKNIQTIEKAAQALGVPFSSLICADDGVQGAIPLNGFVEFQGDMYRIKNVEDLEALLQKVKQR